MSAPRYYSSLLWSEPPTDWLLGGLNCMQSRESAEDSVQNLRAHGRKAELVRVFFEKDAADLEAEVTRLRAALAEIAALQTEEPHGADWNAQAVAIGDTGLARALGRFEAAEMARKGLGKP